MTKIDLKKLHDNALKTLDELVSEKGIYASINAGWSGPFYAWFGRDSAITTDLLFAAVKYGGDKDLATRALKGLLALATWQGTKNNPATGEERGKMPHEIRATFDETHSARYAKDANEKPWFIDPVDGILKNWDSADSTALWVIVVIRAHRALDLSYSESTIRKLRRALKWILNNIETYDGLVGFIGAGLQPGRVYSGLHNQGWKDSLRIYQEDSGELAKHPIKDVLVNAEAWTALSLGSKLFYSHDSDFAQKMKLAAEQLRERFNRKEDGFLLPNKKYFAQAIEGNNRQLCQIAADPAMCLWAYDGNKCAIKNMYLSSVVKTVMSRRMFNPYAGVRNYAIGTVFHRGTRYHGGSDIYWPFVSALIARGLNHYSYNKQAKRVVKAYLKAVHTLGSNIEMFVENNNKKLLKWRHPHSFLGPQSALEQAWTAAAVYYGVYFIEKK